MISLLAITGLVNFICCVFFGFFVLLKNPRGRLNRHYFTVNISIALYSLGYFFWQLSETAAAATTWFHVLLTGVILINSAFLHFVFIFIEKTKERRMELLLYHGLNLFFIVLNLSSQLFSELEPRFDLGYWPRPTQLFHVYLGFWVWQCVYGFSLLLLNLKRSAGLKKEQTKFLTLAAIIGFIGGASNWLVWYDIDFPPYLNIAVSIYVAIIAYAIIRYRLMDIKVALSRAGIFLIVYALVLGVPFLAGFQTDFGFASFVLLFVLSTTDRKSVV
jgi:hypothetical protein